MIQYNTFCSESNSHYLLNFDTLEPHFNLYFVICSAVQSAICVVQCVITHPTFYYHLGMFSSISTLHEPNICFC